MRLIIANILLLITIQVFSQNENSGHIRFFQFKLFENNFDSGIPFVEFCFLENDSIIYGSYSDFDGYSNLYLNANENLIDSIYLRIRYLIGHQSYSKPQIIPLRGIELLEELDIDYKIDLGEFDVNKKISLILTEYRILKPRECKKYNRKHNNRLNRKGAKTSYLYFE